MLPASWGMMVLAYILAPVLPLFASQRRGWVNNHEKQVVGPRLPEWLSWFDTPDNDLFGDDGHAERHAGRSEYYQMVTWLWRNPAYGFEWHGPLAADTTADMPLRLWGNPWIRNRHLAVAGWYFCTVGPYWNYKAVQPLWGDLCFMSEFGWKLQPWAQRRESSGKAMFVFSLRFTAFYSKG